MLSAMVSTVNPYKQVMSDPAQFAITPGSPY
jgi:hypothetical protein